MQQMKQLGSIGLAVLLMLPTHVSAQLTSSNYQIDSYLVGEGTTGQSTSSNFTTEFGVTNFEFDNTGENTNNGSIRSSSGDTNDASDTKSEAAVATTTQNTPAPVTPTQPVVIPDPEPYVAPVPTEYVEPPTTVTELITEVTSGEVMKFTPRYSTASSAEAAADEGFESFYTVLANGDEVYLQLRAGTFLVPAAADESYEIYIRVEAHNLPAAQWPDASYGATLMGDTAYTITVIDSNDTVLRNFAKPITVTINPKETQDYTLGVRGYFFNTALKAWIQVVPITFLPNSIVMEIEQPVLFAAWHTEDVSRVLYLEARNDDDELTIVTTSCLSWYGICWYWYVVPVIVLLLWRVWRRFVI